MSGGVLLAATGLFKAYAGVQALRGASFDLRAGEVHALVGENGAGKSTLVKILTGAVAPDGGEVQVAGERVGPLDPRRAHALGIAAIYQQPALFPALTVAENIALGVEPHGAWRRVDWAARRRRAQQLLDEVGARIAPGREAGRLSMPEQQLVEIARALGASARILFLDEPTASLSDRDTEHLFALLRRLRAQGVGMVYISHRLEELPQVADRVTVLRDGQTIGTRPLSGVTREELIQLMVGRELSAIFPRREGTPGEVVLELRGVGSRAAGVHGVTFDVRAGEIVGLAGLVGAGRTELARALFGLAPLDEGEVVLRGQRARWRSPGDAIAAGVAYLPEDRRRHGVIADMAISHNVTLATLDRFSRRAGFDFARERATALEYVRRLRIKTPALHLPVAALSGGNQQKVALSRWLVAGPSVLILDEPTQGVDVAAKAEIHGLIGELAAGGAAVLMISSEMAEVLGMSDRVAVMRAGTVAAVLPRASATAERILDLALGGAAPTTAPPASAPSPA